MNGVNGIPAPLNEDSTPKKSDGVKESEVKRPKTKVLLYNCKERKNVTESKHERRGGNGQDLIRSFPEKEHSQSMAATRAPGTARYKAAIP